MTDKHDSYNQRISALENLSRSLIIRLGNAETRIAEQEQRDRKVAFDEHEVKSQAAATQATEHLYAPLRSDTKPLLEMSAFVRKVANARIDVPTIDAWHLLRDVILEAQEILKRST
jgi:hypothetical protein